jgi:hypothetical protein
MMMTVREKLKNEAAENLLLMPFCPSQQRTIRMILGAFVLAINNNS